MAVGHSMGYRLRDQDGRELKGSYLLNVGTERISTTANLAKMLSFSPCLRRKAPNFFPMYFQIMYLKLKRS